MAKEETKATPKACINCKATSEAVLLLQGEFKGKEAHVCVHCLPMLIHGAH